LRRGDHKSVEIYARLRHDRAGARRKSTGGDMEQADMENLLQIEDFKPHVGKLVHFKGTRFAFPLDRIVSDRRRLPKGAKRRPFILIFRGIKEHQYMPDGMYECEIEGGPTHVMYVNPIQTVAPEWQEYQAVFN
jgi:hypothetical protein